MLCPFFPSVIQLLSMSWIQESTTATKNNTFVYVICNIWDVSTHFLALLLGHNAVNAGALIEKHSGKNGCWRRWRTLLIGSGDCVYYVTLEEQYVTEQHILSFTFQNLYNSRGGNKKRARVVMNLVLRIKYMLDVQNHSSRLYCYNTTHGTSRTITVQYFLLKMCNNFILFM